MKLAVLTPRVSRNAGGLFQSVRHLHREMGADIETQVFALHDHHTDEDVLAWEGLEVQTYPPLGPSAFGYSPRVRDALATFAPDIVHLHGLWQGLTITSARYHAQYRKPYLISPRGMLDPWALSNSRWKKRIAALLFENRNLKGATCLHALCRAEAEAIRAYGLKNPIAIIPNGVEVPKNIGDGRWRMEDRKTLLFLGRLHPKKGLMNALRAWSTATNSKFKIKNSKLKNWQFVIAGWDDGGHLAELKQLCRELGISERDISADEFLGTPTSDLRPPTSVLFLGPVFGTAKDQLLRSADAFILPSFSEGLPMAVLEAWAYGLPVLMTEHCNLPEGFAAGAAVELILNDECLMFNERHQFRPPHSKSTLAEGFRILFEMSDSDRLTMGRKGRELVERQFTWPQVAKQMKEVYECLIFNV